MPTWGRNAGRKTTEQREWVHVDGIGAVTVGLTQPDADQAIGQEVQALLA
jgi:glycine cleavage system H lipoate-binding protein